VEITDAEPNEVGEMRARFAHINLPWTGDGDQPPPT
jgi:hypothetical protein